MSRCGERLGADATLWERRELIDSEDNPTKRRYNDWLN